MEPLPLRATFEEVVLPHLDAGYRLARWLMRNEHDAEDVVQDASLRALRYFRTFAGGNGRAWFLRIVRNTCHGGRRRFHAVTDPFDEERHSTLQSGSDPEALMMRTDTAVLIERAIGSLPDRFRELLVLRELEGLSYRELAEVMDIPIGTVMSGLSRAREALRTWLSDELKTATSEPALRSFEHLAAVPSLSMDGSRPPDPGSRIPDRASSTMRAHDANVEQEAIEEAVV